MEAAEGGARCNHPLILVGGEAVSRDESSCGRLSCSHEFFRRLGDFSCGTTNVDYSNSLYQDFQKIRGYKETCLTVDPIGFEVSTSQEESHREVKIDLPDSWVRGFLQVSSAMTLPTRRVVLHPMDVHNICFLLRRRQERRFDPSRFVLSRDHSLSIILLTQGLPWKVYQSERVVKIRRPPGLGQVDATLRHHQ